MKRRDFLIAATMSGAVLGLSACGGKKDSAGGGC